MTDSKALVEVKKSPSPVTADGSQPVPGRCNARRSNGQGYCMKLPAAGRTRCYKHGGATPIGPASPQFKHGRRSKYLPGNVAALYEEALQNPQLMSLRDEIALLDMAINQNLEAVTWGESRERWETVISSALTINRAIASGDANLLAAAVNDLTRVANNQSQSDTAINDVVNFVEQRRRLVETQTKLEAVLNQNITAERAVLFAAAIADIVTRHVTDPEIRQRIAQDIRALTMGHRP